MQKTAALILEKLFEAKKIVIISHRNPDADTIGSNIALRLFLETKGKKVESVCADQLPEGNDFLPLGTTFKNSFQAEEGTVLVTVDAGSPAQTVFLEKQPELKQYETINIDHHRSNPLYGDINFVIDTAASTTFVLYQLFKIWEVEISTTLATCLLYGLYFDTGSFMHSNTNSEVYALAAILLEKGADKKVITQALFKNRPIHQLKLWGKVLENAALTENNVAVSVITQKEFLETETRNEHLSGVIDYLSSVNGNNYAALISEDMKGNIKGSLRTKKDDVNVAEIASFFKGGGHTKASGFTIPGTIKKEVTWKIIPPENKSISTGN